MTDQSSQAYVSTQDAKKATHGRETEILHALGIDWSVDKYHINCPYPGHNDNNPSWRWDNEKSYAFCTCSEKPASIFDVIMKIESLDFEAAKIRAVEILGRRDLVRRKSQGTRQRFAIDALMDPPDHQRDDLLPVRYLAHRLGVTAKDVVRPATRYTGWRNLSYFDPPPPGSKKPVLVGDYPCVIFETTDAAGKVCGTRIYVQPNGLAKADLGQRADGQARPTKKAVKSLSTETTAGRAVVFGVPKKAPHILLAEGLETGAALALAFKDEISEDKLAVASALTTSGIRGFNPYAATKKITVAADRDEMVSIAKPTPSKAGEKAAIAFAEKYGGNVDVRIAMPGRPGESVDWLNVLRRDGSEGVRRGIADAQKYEPADISPPCPDSSSGEHSDVDGLLNELAGLNHLDYELCRKKAADKIGVRTSALDEEVARLRGNDHRDDGGGGVFLEIDPWPELVNGAALLDEIAHAFRRYMALPDGAAEATALWVLHAHTHDSAYISPILAITSPEKRCGKSTMLGILQALAPRSLSAANTTAAALFRAVEAWRPTVLIDEADTFLRDNDDLRGVLNSGHNRSGAHILRTVGDNHEPKTFSTWAPKAIALIGNLRDTLADRAIMVKLRRKRPEESVDRFRLDRVGHLNEITRRAVRWANDNADILRLTDPNVPPGLHDRAADNWRHLLAISDLAGGHWPETARKVAVALSGDDEQDEASAGVMLLGDIRRLFDDGRREALFSELIIEKLGEMEERPWPEWRQGKPITQRQVARLLKPFGVGPKQIRIESVSKKGYECFDFKDAFDRYLANEAPKKFDQNSAAPAFRENPIETTETSLKYMRKSENRSETRNSVVSDRNQESPNEFNIVSDVSDENPLKGKEGAFDHSKYENEVFAHEPIKEETTPGAALSVPANTGLECNDSDENNTAETTVDTASVPAAPNQTADEDIGDQDTAVDKILPALGDVDVDAAVVAVIQQYGVHDVFEVMKTTAGKELGKNTPWNVQIRKLEAAIISLQQDLDGANAKLSNAKKPPNNPDKTLHEFKDIILKEAGIDFRKRSDELYRLGITQKQYVDGKRPDNGCP
jgi:putative DNA primase/helicase